MVGTIAPAVRGQRRISVGPPVANVVGGAAGGAVAGLALSLMGTAIALGLKVPRESPWSALMVAAIAGWYGLHELGVVRSFVPQRKRQVPHAWRFKRPLVGQFQYGFVLGTGVFTYVRVTTLLVLVAWVAARGDLATGALVMGTFGFSRSLASSAVAATRASQRDAGLVVEVLRPLGEAVHKVNGGSLVLLCGWLLAGVRGVA